MALVETREAFTTWEKSQDLRNAMWNTINCDEDLELVEDFCRRTWETVCAAFHRDTKDVNDFMNCLLIDAIWVKNQLDDEDAVKRLEALPEHERIMVLED